MTHYNIPLVMKSAYKNTEVAVAHHKLIQDLQSLRRASEKEVDEIRSLDTVNIDARTEAVGKDLAFGAGKVRVLKPNKGSMAELELEYDTATGRTEKFSARTDSATISQTDSTYKLEEGRGDDKRTTYFQFHDEAGYVTLSDPDHDRPAILNGVDPRDMLGRAPQNSEGLIVS